MMCICIYIYMYYSNIVTELAYHVCVYIYITSSWSGKNGIHRMIKSPTKIQIHIYIRMICTRNPKKYGKMKSST